jgi:hypothetical protein
MRVSSSASLHKGEVFELAQIRASDSISSQRADSSTSSIAPDIVLMKSARDFARQTAR